MVTFLVIIVIFAIAIVIPITFLYSALGGRNNTVYTIIIVSVPVLILLYYSYLFYNLTIYTVMFLIMVYISIAAFFFLHNNASAATFLKEKYEDFVSKWNNIDISSKVKPTVIRMSEKLLQVMYVFGLLGFPVYKLFIERRVHIDGFLDLLAVILVFVIYLVFWFFLFTPIYWLICIPFFLKGDDLKDFRRGCGYPVLFVVCLVVAGVLYGKCNLKEPTNKSKIYSKETLMPAESTNDKNSRTEKQVYVCTGPQSSRYHSSRYCRGLNSCSDDIELIGVETAKEMGRTPCRICH